MNQERKFIVGVIGPNQALCPKEIYDFGLLLGRRLIDDGYLIVCGGMFGIMEAVCRGARNSPVYSYGCTIGIIPSVDKKSGNPYCDIVIPTGMGLARNVIIVNTADVLVAVGGGSGTLSEIAHAWQTGKEVLCYTGFDGWAKELANRQLDTTQERRLIPVHSIEEIMNELRRILYKVEI
ncbi:MAG: TIGR00725 family protein [Leptospiraceae bacterium]|nr:TIGR00725 family protein [Leptospiraceae bacterium]MDW7975118.1 TIGR00725 family protein [Leptospiraceae bacterium]